jgi:hypothetical protein
MTAIAKGVPFGTFKRPDPRIVDPSKVRLGDSMVTGQFPPRREPDSKTTDPGKVRFGDSMVTGKFPARQ